MGTELFTVLTVTEARKAMAACLPVELRRVEEVPLLAALGRRLGSEIRAAEDIPGFARSVVDGFAVHAQDTFGASDGLPAFFPVVGEVLMGQYPDRALAPGEAIRVATGAMLPQGADAVVMVEYTEEVGGTSIEVVKPVAPGDNMVRADEDAARGEVLFPVNHLLRPQDIGYLAAQGVTSLPVYRPLRVGIISTGDEIVPPEQRPCPGQVRDVNSYTIYAQTAVLGGEPHLYGTVGDNPEQLEARLRLAHQECDLVLLSGGSSVGRRDFTGEIIDRLGTPGVVFHGLGVKPGKPTLGGVSQGKPIFGLPGHPAAAMISYDLMVAPLIQYGSYTKYQPGAPLVEARISRSLASAPGREEYIRVRLRHQDDGWWADPVLGKSGLLRPMVEADGLVRIALESEGVAAGDQVGVYLFKAGYFL